MFTGVSDEMPGLRDELVTRRLAERLSGMGEELVELAQLTELTRRSVSGDTRERLFAAPSRTCTTRTSRSTPRRSR
jgi:hypothetical protein